MCTKLDQENVLPHPFPRIVPLSVPFPSFVLLTFYPYFYPSITIITLNLAFTLTCIVTAKLNEGKAQSLCPCLYLLNALQGYLYHSWLLLK